MVLQFLSCATPAESPQVAPVAPLVVIVAPIPDLNIEDDLTRASEADIPLWLAQNIRAAALVHTIPLDLAYALVSAESDFTIRAESWAGARGLTQVMPATGMAHCLLTPDALYIPDLNLRCGFSYLAMMFRTFGDWNLALMAYHRGPYRVSYELANNLGHGVSVAYASGILASSFLD